MSNNLISPKEIALWLIDKTSLTFQQIADATKLNIQEIEFIANKIYFVAAAPMNPIELGIFTKEDIELAQKDSNIQLKAREIFIPSSILKKIDKKRNKKASSLKKSIPNCAYYLIDNLEKEIGVQFSDSDIAKLLGSTKDRIGVLRQKINNKEMKEFKTNPVSIGLCTKEDLSLLTKKTLKKKGG